MVEIKLATANELAALDKTIHPQPAKNFVPSWFKDMPVKVPLENSDYKSDLMPYDRTVKACPSMQIALSSPIIHLKKLINLLPFKIDSILLSSDNKILIAFDLLVLKVHTLELSKV